MNNKTVGKIVRVFIASDAVEACSCSGHYYWPSGHTVNLFM